MGEAGGADDVDAAMDRTIQAAQENGLTMPVVPRIESPPTMPSGGSRSAGKLGAVGNGDGDFGRRAAAAAGRDLGHDLGHHPARHQVDRGLAGRDGRPGLVTVPTPARPLKTTRRFPPAAARTVDCTTARWVTSGSSPRPYDPGHGQIGEASTASAKLGCWPFGRAMVTGSGKWPVSRASESGLGRGGGAGARGPAMP